MKVPVRITVNRRLYERDVEPRLLLGHFIRRALTTAAERVK